MLYAKSTGGFYDPSINATIPPDAVQITNDQYHSLLTAQSAGQVITADKNGNPIAVDPKSLMTLAQVQAAQSAVLFAAYQNAIQQPVSYTSKGGVSKTYQADPQSVQNLQNSIAGCLASQATPAGFFWVAADNTQVPFAYADLTGLASAIFAQGEAAFVHLQAQKAAVLAATTVSAVQAIGW